MSENSLSITITVEPTDNAKVFTVDGVTCSGRAEVKAALLDAAKDAILTAMADLFPGKALSVEPETPQQ